MAKINFTVEFKGTLEIPQADLVILKKDENGIWNNADPKDFSPEEIKQLVADGELSVVFAELLKSPNVVQVENELEVDYNVEQL